MLKRWRSGVAVAVTVAASLVASTVTAAPAASQASASAGASPAPPSACMSSNTPPAGLVPFDPASDYTGPPLLLPAWADTAGWIKPQQYETIVAGDVDGDGRGELIGRNAGGIETHSWAPPFRKPGDPSAPTTVDQAPGQWTQLYNGGLPFSERGTVANIPGTGTGTAGGYFDASYYTTFRLANIDGLGGDELIVRQPQLTPGSSGNPPVYNGDIMAVYRFVNGAWDPTPIPGPAWNNWGTDSPSWGNHPQGWFNPQYYETITTGNIDGQGGDEIIGRGPGGIESWTLNANGTGFTRLDGGNAILTDAEGWAASPMQYSTIRVADFTGDGADDIAALATDQNPYPFQGAGMLLYTFNPGGQSWSWSGTVNSWIPENGWNKPEQYGSITAGDIDGKPGAEIIGRGPNGLEAYHSQIDPNSGQRVWAPLIDAPAALAGATYNQPQYYSTLQAGDVLASTGPVPVDEVLYRDVDGLHTLTYNSTTRAFDDIGVVLGQFSDANGWNADPARYSTIHTVMTTSGAPRAVIGKDAAGVRTYVLDPVARPTQWINPSTPFPAWAGGTDDTNLGDNTDPGRSYQYINTSVTEAMYGDFAPTQSVRSMFHELGTDMSQVADEVPKTKPMSLNVPRSTYQAVEQDVTDWTNAVNYLRGYYFADSGSLQQLIETTLLVASNNSYSVSAVADVFSNNGDKFLTLMVDLIVGIIGAAAVAFGATFPITFAGLTMLGAGAQAGIQFTNLNGQIDATKDDLDNAIVNTFCHADAFLFGTHEQIVDDYGLLTAMAEMYGSGVIRFTDTSYPQAQQMADKGRAVWVYQQFAGAHGNGWTAGRCWQSLCNLNNISGFAGSYSGSFQYQMITTDGSGTGNCLHASDNSYSTLVQDLGVDPMDWTSPTKMFWSDGSDFQSTWGSPIFFQYDGKSSQGILGWHIKTEDCQNLSTP